MSDAYPWYGLAHGQKLEQGDFFIGCPIFRPTTGGRIYREAGAQSDKGRGFASCRLIESISRRLLHASSCGSDCLST
jgi:hypothetical protein